MKNIFLKTSVTTDITPLNVSDLNSATRAVEWNSGRQSPIPTWDHVPLLDLCCTSAQWAQQSPCEGTCQAKPRSPQCLTAKTGHQSPVGPQPGAQGRHEEHNNFGFTPVFFCWKQNLVLLWEKETKKLHLTYLPLEWSRQISTLKGIAFKSSMDFENNIIAWYHKQFPIFRSSWARLSFSPSSNNSIKVLREMELKWTGIHFL